MPNSNYVQLRCIALALCVTTLAAEALAQEECPEAQVIAHVKEQFQVYGPQSLRREFFGFIYLDGNQVKSSVARGPYCVSARTCSVDPRGAADALPPRTKVLGEWHTHPGGEGSNALSADDVRGAWNNRRIRCYIAFYAASNGNFYSWKAASSSVPVAMNSRVLLGNYRQPENSPPPAIIAAHQDPGSKCLSTNTNARTAATTMKSCKKSVTSR